MRTPIPATNHNMPNTRRLESEFVAAVFDRGKFDVKNINHIRAVLWLALAAKSQSF